MIKEQNWFQQQQPDLTIPDKVNEEIQKCKKQILKNDVSKAIIFLKQFINSRNQYIKLYPFKGIGNLQDWIYHQSKGPIEWFKMACKQKMVENNPFDLMNFCYIVLAYEKRWKVPTMLKKYIEIRNSYDRNQLLMGVANIYYLNCQYKQAQKVYKRYYQTGTSNQKILQNLTWVNYRLGRKQQARQYCEKYIVKNPDGANACFLNAILKQDPALSIGWLKHLSKKLPNFYRIYIELGQLQEDINESLMYFNKALSFEPQSAYILARIANTYLQLNLQEATRFAKQALKIDLECGQAETVLGKVALKNDDFILARSHFDRAIKMSPFNFEFLFNLAQMHQRQGNSFQAVKCFERCEEENPYSATVQNKLGSLSIITNLDSGQKYFKKAIQIDPQSTKGLWNLALIEKKRNNYPKAIQLYARAHQIDPKQTKYWVVLAQCYSELNCLKEANEWVLKYLDTKQTTYEGACYQVLSNYQRKSRRYEKALEWHFRWIRSTESQKIPSFINEWSEAEGILAVKGIIKNLLTKIPKVTKHFYELKNLMSICRHLQMYDDQNYLSIHTKQIEKSLQSQKIRKTKRVKREEK